MQSPKIIAHRGVSAEAEENTLTAFQKAIDLKVDFAELDVRLTKDKVPVVFHDATLSRRYGIFKPIDQLTFKDLQTIKTNQEKIPSLSEVLNLDWQSSGLMIEIKKCKQPALLLVEAVFNALSEAKHLPKSIIIGSFDEEILKKALEFKHKINTKIEFIGIIEDVKMIEPFINQKISKIAIWQKLVSIELIKKLNKKNIETFVFTVNTYAKAMALTQLGISGIITNNPRKITRK